MSPLEIAQINLVFQVIILFLLWTGYFLKRRNRFFQHGTAMLMAVTLNAVSIFLVMGPSLLGWLGFIQANPLARLSIVLLFHAVIGATCELLGVWIVVSWHFQSSTQGCVGKKRIMLLTLGLWVTNVLLGFLLYFYIYGWSV